MVLEFIFATHRVPFFVSACLLTPVNCEEGFGRLFIVDGALFTVGQEEAPEEAPGSGEGETWPLLG